MSIEHKAYLFDYSLFNVELRPILLAALMTGEVTELVEFVDNNTALLRDPYEGAPLTMPWLDILEWIDPHQVGDVALTKYYRPSADIGLGAGWLEIEEALSGMGDVYLHLLGRPLQAANGVVFDPGKIGSYFQSGDEVSAGLSALDAFCRREPSSRRQAEALLEVLRRANDAGVGLYTTF